MTPLHELVARHREAIGFVIVGFTNTFLTWLVYLAFNVVMPYLAAYTLTYAVGIVLSYVLNTRFVFRVAMSWDSFLKFPAVYAVQWASRTLILYVLVRWLHVPESYAPFGVSAVTVPMTFVLSRFILKKPSAPTSTTP